MDWGTGESVAVTGITRPNEVVGGWGVDAEQTLRSRAAGDRLL